MKRGVTMGLREQKKADTRQRISNAATVLFHERGFDAVTIEEVADAAQVSKKTVFNYFPRKEDMFFDREHELKTLLRLSVLERKKGETRIAAVHRLVHELREVGHPFAAPNATHASFWKVVLASPALMSRARELGDEAAQVLAKVLAESAGARTTDGTADLLASLVLATWRAAYADALRALPGPKKAEAAFSAMIDRGFAAIEAAAKNSPYA